MKPTYHYTTVLEALEDLNDKGFNYDFNLHQQDIKLNPQNYQVKHIYRYEGYTDPDEESVVYGIESVFGKKGVFVSGFSANSDDETLIVLNKLSMSS